MHKYVKKIESVIINRFDQHSGEFRYYLGKRNIGSLGERKNNKCIFYLMAPSFGNIGDEAIVEASILYLKDYYPEYTVLVIDFLDTIQMLKEIRRFIREDDIIFLQGGGNIGTLYYEAEIMREFIIKRFPDIKIVSMPQSMYFSNTPSGKKKLDHSKKIYNSHKKLTLIARENYSYCKMKNEYQSCNVLLLPDIVFYLSKGIKQSKPSNRAGVMTCLRTDKEDVLGTKRIQLIEALFQEFEELIISDTCVPRNISNETRYYEVFSLINQFSKMKLVITDRLHGMILAALTNTPCIVMPSLDTKVLGTYEWIKDNEMIRFISEQSMEDIISIAKEMVNTEYSTFDWNQFRLHYFSDLRKRIGG